MRVKPMVARLNSTPASPNGKAVHAPPSSSQSAAGPNLRLLFIAVAIILGAQCVAGAISAVAHQSAFSEYLSQARRCVELNDCPSRGGRTGALPLFHGASWIRLLAYSLRTGADLTRVQHIVLGLWMLSLPVTFFFVHRYLGLRAATLALGLYFPVVLVGTDITSLTYTNLLPLPLSLYYASLALFIESRRTLFGAVASVALAAAVSAELGSIVLVPFQVFLVALTARKPPFAVAAVGLSFAIPFCFESTDAARAIVAQVPTLRFAAGLAIGAGAAVLIVRASPRGLRLAAVLTPERIRTVMTAALIYATIAIWVTDVLLMRAVPAPRYLLPASFPLLFLVAERMRNLGMRATLALGAAESAALMLLPPAPRGLLVLQAAVMLIVTLYALELLIRSLRGPGPLPVGVPWPVIAVCVCGIGLAAADRLMLWERGTAQAFTLAEAERLVPKLYAAGYTYGALLGSLQGPAADDLLPLLTERDPQAFSTPPPLLNQDFSLLVMKAPNALLSRTYGVLVAVPVDGSQSAIVVRSERSYLDWIHMRRCRWTSDTAHSVSYSCWEPRTDQPLPHNWPYVEFAARSPIADPPQPPDGSLHFEIPVHAPGRGITHIVRTANEWPTTWRIARVSGVEFEGDLPAAEIRLPDRREATGVVEIEYTGWLFGDLPWCWLPHMMEVTQDNEHLLEPFRARR
jgi:hypothetical protein